MWDSILNQVYRVNITLQKSNISISNASKIVMGLKNALEEMRNEGSENINLLANNVCNEAEISTIFKSKRMIEFCNKYQITLGHSTSYYPQGNGGILK